MFSSSKILRGAQSASSSLATVAHFVTFCLYVSAILAGPPVKQFL